MILDSDFIIDLMRKNEPAVRKLQQLRNQHEQLEVTTLTLFELMSGSVRCGKPLEERKKILAVLGGRSLLTFDEKSAERAGEIDGGLAKKGRSIGPVDCMIAGVALTRHETLVTRNIKDFSRVQGLKIESY